MPNGLPTLRTFGACAAGSLLPLVCFLCSASPVAGQPIPAPKNDGLEQLTAPRAVPSRDPAVASLGGNENVAPIDFATALRLVGTNNLDVAQAREAVTQSRIQIQQSQLLMLPSVIVGSTYYGHEGQIAKTEGNIITANKDSLFVGLGPSISVNFADAIFTPLVARQAGAAATAGARRVYNDTLLQVSQAYFAVLRAVGVWRASTWFWNC